MSDVDTNDVLELAAVIRALPHGAYREGAAAEAEAILDSDWGRPHARLVSENAALRERNEYLTSLVRSLESRDGRPMHLIWQDNEWVDDRCGCRYHPDDDNNTHGGGPHVHACAEHATAHIDIGPDLHDEPGQPAPGQDNPPVRLTRHSELRFGVEQHTFVAECGCVFEWDTTYDDPHWHQCAAHEPQEPDAEPRSPERVS